MATYLILNIVMTAIVLVFVRGGLRKSEPRALGGTVVALVILTVIFDAIIIGLGIVGYDPAKILNVRIGVVPIEDFFYAIVAALIVPALWERNGRG